MLKVNVSITLNKELEINVDENFDNKNINKEYLNTKLIEKVEEQHYLPHECNKFINEFNETVMISNVRTKEHDLSNWEITNFNVNII